MSKRFRGLALAGLLVLTLLSLLTACGDSTPTSGAGSAATVATTTTAAATTASTTTVAATTASSTTAAATTQAITTAATTQAATTAAMSTQAATTAATTTQTATTAAAGQSAGFPLTITDDAKRSVKFAKAPARIVSLAPSNTELLFALGLGDRVVGVDDNSNYPAEVSKKDKIGGYNTTNLEKVVALSPDLVLASSITSKDLLTSLEGRNLTVVVFNPLDLAGVAANIKLLGQIAGVPDKGNAVAADFQKQLDDIAAKFKTVPARPRVFYELDPTLYTVGPGSFINDMIEKAGGQNIVTDPSNPYPQLNQEAVIGKDPQVVLVADDSGGTDTPEKILTRPGWESISAIKNKRVYALPADLVNRPGPRAAQGVAALAKALYPDLFK